jgi:enamine deaminase RidA (YjgF/YER057c/UK114 family)
MVLALYTQALEAQQGGPIKVIEVAGQLSLQASSAGIMAGPTLYIAAQDGRQPNGSLPATFEQETSQALSHVSAVAHAAGMEMENLVALRIYLTDAGQVDELYHVYWKMIGAKPPTRTVLIIGALPHGAHIAIDGIAVASSVARQVIQPSGWSIGTQTSPPGISSSHEHGECGVDKPLSSEFGYRFGTEWAHRPQWRGCSGQHNEQDICHVL